MTSKILDMGFKTVKKFFCGTSMYNMYSGKLAWDHGHSFKKKFVDIRQFNQALWNEKWIDDNFSHFDTNGLYHIQMVLTCKNLGIWSKSSRVPPLKKFHRSEFLLYHHKFFLVHLEYLGSSGKIFLCLYDLFCDF